MNTSVAAINERDFASHLVDDASDPSRPSDSGSGTVDDGARRPGEQLLRRLFNPQVDGQSAVPQQPPAAPAHRFDAQDLYDASGPKGTDIDQDNLGDCYFVATMGAIADKQPDRIKNAIQYDPATGNYTVTPHKKEWGWMPPRVNDKAATAQVTQQEVEDTLKPQGGTTVDTKS